MRVLTQNMFGIFVAPNVKERMAAFANPEVLGKYDVVCMQEVFDDTHFEQIKIAGKECGLDYSFRFATAAVVNNGLGVLSRFPILKSDFMQFFVGGLPEKLHGDFYANKGMAYVQLAVPLTAVIPPSSSVSSQQNIAAGGIIAAGTTQQQTQRKPSTSSQSAAFQDELLARLSVTPEVVAATHAGFPLGGTMSMSASLAAGGGTDGGGPSSPKISSNGIKVPHQNASQHQLRYLRVNVYTTHTVAPYEALSIVGFENEMNSGYRTSQLLQAIEFIENTGTGGGQADHIILCGDLNVQGHHSPEMRALRCHFNTFCPERRRNSINGRNKEINGTPKEGGSGSGGGAPPMSNNNSNEGDGGGALLSVFQNEDATTFSRENTFNRKIEPASDDLPAQLDLMLYSSSVLEVFEGTGEVVHTDNEAVTILPAKGKENDPPKKMPFSDHYGVAARFVLSPVCLGLRSSLRAAEPSARAAGVVDSSTITVAGEKKHNKKKEKKDSSESELDSIKSINGYDPDELTIAADFLRRRATRMIGGEKTGLYIKSFFCFILIPNFDQVVTPFLPGHGGWIFRLCWTLVQLLCAVLGAFFMMAAIVQRPNDALAFRCQAERLEAKVEEEFRKKRLQKAQRRPTPPASDRRKSASPSAVDVEEQTPSLSHSRVSTGGIQVPLPPGSVPGSQTSRSPPDFEVPEPREDTDRPDGTYLLSP